MTCILCGTCDCTIETCGSRRRARRRRKFFLIGKDYPDGRRQQVFAWDEFDRLAPGASIDDWCLAFSREEARRVMTASS